MPEGLKPTPPEAQNPDSGRESDVGMAHEMAKSATELQSFRSDLRGKEEVDAAESLQGDVDKLYQAGRGRETSQREMARQKEIDRQEKEAEREARRAVSSAQEKNEHSEELVQVGKIIAQIKNMENGGEVQTSEEIGQRVKESFSGWEKANLGSFQHWFPRYEFPDAPNIPADIRMTSFTGRNGPCRLWAFSSTRGMHFLVSQ